MQRRQFIRVAGGGAIVAASASSLVACSTDVPAEAVAAWSGPNPGETDVRRWILSHAILAPHSHNLQSWLVDLGTPAEITLYLDRGPGRLLPETDPWSRQMMLSQGTFLELLDLAARQKGLRADITLFPQGQFGPQTVDGRPAAHIRLTPDTSVQTDALFAEIFKRRTNREAYEAKEPSAQSVQAITASVASFTRAAGADLAMRVGFARGAQEQVMQQHRAIAAEAFRIETVTPRTMLESFKVLRVGPSEIAQHRDGIAMMSPMVRALVAAGLFDRNKPPKADDAAVTGQIKDFNAKIATTPAFFWLITEGNDRKTQINAGRAYVRAQLAATAQGLSMQPLSQALQEYPEQAQTYADIHQLLQAPAPRYTVQMWTRLGYARPIGPSPRRGLESHLIKKQT